MVSDKIVWIASHCLFAFFDRLQAAFTIKAPVLLRNDLLGVVDWIDGALLWQKTKCPEALFLPSIYSKTMLKTDGLGTIPHRIG